jgi:hypothetical protein
VRPAATSLGSVETKTTSALRASIIRVNELCDAKTRGKAIQECGPWGYAAKAFASPLRDLCQNAMKPAVPSGSRVVGSVLPHQPTSTGYAVKCTWFSGAKEIMEISAAVSKPGTIFVVGTCSSHPLLPAGSCSDMANGGFFYQELAEHNSGTLVMHIEKAGAIIDFARFHLTAASETRYYGSDGTLFVKLRDDLGV